MNAGLGRSVLSVPDFRRLWLVGLLVSVARWLEMLVVSLVVFQSTGSAFLVTGMVLLRLAPMGVFGVLLGVLADRIPRRLALLAVLAVQAVAVGALGALAVGGSLAVWHVAVACLLGGLGWATDNPVRRMMVGEAVGPARMSQAMSLDVVANNASRIAGPALGGTLLAVLGAGAAFGLSFLLYGFAMLAAMRIRAGSVAAEARGKPVLREMRESFQLALHLPRLRAVLVITVIFNVFAWPCTSLVPVVGQVAHGLGPSGVGVLASMEGAGALLGAGLVGLLARPARFAMIYAGGTALYLCMLVVFALAPGAAWAGGALLLLGVGNAGFGTMQATLTYLASPPEIRGKALGLLSTAIGTGLVGFLQLGMLADWVGAPLATALVGLQGLVVLILTWRLWRPLLSPA